jgi:hypothetical protein
LFVLRVVVLGKFFVNNVVLEGLLLQILEAVKLPFLLRTSGRGTAAQLGVTGPQPAFIDWLVLVLNI